MSLLRSLFDPGDWLAIKPQLDPQSPVLQLTHVPDAGEVKLRIWLGLAVLAVVVVVIYFVRRDGFAVFVACGFGFFGLLNLVYGVLQSGFSMSPAITSSGMIVNPVALSGAHNRRERRPAVSSSSNRKKLEWVRDYLPYRLTART